MKAEIVLTKKQVLYILFQLLKSKTQYNNKYPYNLGYMSDKGIQSFDCWNLHKAIINSRGQLLNFKAGQYQKDLSLTGDCSGKTLLSYCTERSKDFSKIVHMPWATYLYMNGHAGWFIGEFELEDGKIYNVIECTASWSKNVLASYVDPDGTRRHWKGCSAKNGKWEEYGLLSNWIDYEMTEEKPVEEAKQEEHSEQKYYTVQKGDTLSKIAQMLGTTWQELAKVNNIQNPNLIHPGDVLEIPTYKPTVPGYYLRNGNMDSRVRDLRKCLKFLGYQAGDTASMVYDTSLTNVVRDFQRRNGLVTDGIYGPKTREALVRSINGR